MGGNGGTDVWTHKWRISTDRAAKTTANGETGSISSNDSSGTDTRNSGNGSNAVDGNAINFAAEKAINGGG